VYLWMPVLVVGVVRLACALIDWRARIDYERARAASVVAVLRAVPGGVTVRDSRADGTVLSIEMPARPALPGHGIQEVTEGKPC
jgi:hypothetical protein